MLFVLLYIFWLFDWYLNWVFLDINECALGLCHVDANCTNIPGSFQCACKSGFTGDGRTSCVGKLSFPMHIMCNCVLIFYLPQLML